MAETERGEALAFPQLECSSEKKDNASRTPAPARTPKPPVADAVLRTQNWCRTAFCVPMPRGQPFHATRRLPAKKLSFYRRHAALCTNEKLQIDFISKKTLTLTKIQSLLNRVRSAAVGPRAYRRYLLMKSSRTRSHFFLYDMPSMPGWPLAKTHVFESLLGVLAAGSCSRCPSTLCPPSLRSL